MNDAAWAIIAIVASVTVVSFLAGMFYGFAVAKGIKKEERDNHTQELHEKDRDIEYWKGKALNG